MSDGLLGPEDEVADLEERPLAGGARLGRYTVERVIGSGAMGTVYAAADEFGQGVALKVVSRARTVSAEAVARFRTEAVAASRIGHRNIAEVFEFGTADDGSIFIAMELLEGEDLRSRLRRVGKLKLPEVAFIAEGAAAGLAVARERGIVHRDLKPENIFLARGGTIPGLETLKVLDFGVAKALGLSPDRKTGRSGITGTPEYMAPEQAAEGDVDSRSDIYALGCVLYECVTGNPPFSGKNFVEILAKHLRQPPVAPSSLTPPVEIPPVMEAAIMKALAKDPAERFQRIEDLAEQIRLGAPRPTRPPPALADGRRSAAPRPPGPPPSPAPPRRLQDDPTSNIVERITREFEIEREPPPRPGWQIYLAAFAAGLFLMAVLYALLR